MDIERLTEQEYRAALFTLRYLRERERMSEAEYNARLTELDNAYINGVEDDLENPDPIYRQYKMEQYARMEEAQRKMREAISQKENFGVKLEGPGSTGDYSIARMKNGTVAQRMVVSPLEARLLAAEILSKVKPIKRRKKEMTCDLCKVDKNESMIGIGVPGGHYGKICTECALKVRESVEVREAYVHEEARRSIQESEPNVEEGRCCVCGYTGKAKRFWHHPSKFALLCPDCLNAISDICREKSPAESVKDFEREYKVATERWRNLKAECNTLRNRLQMREDQLNHYRDHAKRCLQELETKGEIIKLLREEPDTDREPMALYVAKRVCWAAAGIVIYEIICGIFKAFA